MYCGYGYLRDAFRTTSLSLGSEAVVSSGVNKLVRTDSQLLVPPRMAPADGDTLAHLVFALKHEGINLEILSQVLAKLDSSLLQEALDDKPSSAIYRKLGWLYEEFTQKQLDYGRPFGNYVDFFDENFYFTGPKRQIPRWRLIFNGLGNLTYCPIVRKTEKLTDENTKSVFAELDRHFSSVPSQLLQRAADWAYLSETRSSFEIEKEAPNGSKAERFVALLKNAGSFDRLDEDSLCEIQNRIVSTVYSQAVSYRTEQNWLANTTGAGFRRITYVPPPPEMLDDLMSGLLSMITDAPSATNPLIAAGTASFGFVYLHPFMDGNGRLSRFLVHQQLIRSGVLPKGHILPVSAAMLQHERDYLRALEAFSAPCRELWETMQIDDGQYDFLFHGTADLYRYWDATTQCEFLYEMVKEAVSTYLPEEIRFLETYDGIYRVLNASFDVVQKDLDVLVAAAIQSGRVSLNLRKKYRYKVPEALFDTLQSLLEKHNS